ncbi:MAG: TatD family hydrolase [Nannocystales bacterium]
MGTPKIPPTLPGLIDAHCHLDYAPMSADLQACFDAGTAAGVVQYVHVGCSPESIDRAVELADAHEQVFAAIGVHPHEAKHTDAALLGRLREHAKNPSVLAIGETGLDYHYDLSPREDQRRSFSEHVELARELDMPLVLHIRDAHEEALAIVAEAGPRADMPGMVHCFTAGPDAARAWLDLGFHISFSGISTFKKCSEIREAAALTPEDRILVETDAPYLAPEPLRGRENIPAYVAFTCARLAEVRGITPAALATQAAQNTRALLSMPPPADTVAHRAGA